MDILVPTSERESSHASDYMNEIEHNLRINQSSSSEEEEEETENSMPVQIKLPRQKKIYQEDQSFGNNAREEDNSSNESHKPSRVVFRKSSQGISRAERANKMAHFDYIESGLANTEERTKQKEARRVKVNPKFFNSMNKESEKVAQGSNNKSMTVHKSQPLQIKKFSPKRFRRFPRFTIFLNKDQENVFEKENSISLNPQFLNFLMTPERAEIVDQGKNSFHNFLATEEFDEALKLLNSQNLKKFDPFDRVILSAKGIDNSILTSLRTLAKLNNSISDTFKVIHSKFIPGQMTNPSFAYKKEIAHGERNYGLQPPLDMSMFADDQKGRAFSMGPPLKRVYKQMMRANNFNRELPQIDENPRKGFKGNKGGPKFSSKIVSEMENSQFNFTSREDIERMGIISPPDFETESAGHLTDPTPIYK